MIIIHIESGLGNQMLSFVEYLALKKCNPDTECFIETMLYEIPECQDGICQWNGYELERIFGIKAPNVKDLMTVEQYETVKAEVAESEFWKRHWNYPPYIVAALNNVGLNVVNNRGEVRLADYWLNCKQIDGCYKAPLKTIVREWLYRLTPVFHIRRLLQKRYEKKIVIRYAKESFLFYKVKENVFTGQWLGFARKGSGIERIDTEIQKTFTFPPITDEKNLKMLTLIQNCNSVSIHARRGDALAANDICYRYKYFKRAVKYIKKKVSEPVFIFFSDPGSIEWCKHNLSEFSLDADKDKIFYVDWNKGEDSYRDMQLMAKCKHNIITKSSFGWWGAYLNKNPDKITISPDIMVNTTHSF